MTSPLFSPSRSSRASPPTEVRRPARTKIEVKKASELREQAPSLPRPEMMGNVARASTKAGVMFTRAHTHTHT